jgi:hypothetical protein
VVHLAEGQRVALAGIFLVLFRLFLLLAAFFFDS